MPAFGFMTMYICTASSVYCVAFGCTLYINTMKTTFNFNFDFYGWIQLSYQLVQFLFNYLNTLFRLKLVNNQTKIKMSSSLYWYNCRPYKNQKISSSVILSSLWQRSTVVFLLLKTVHFMRNLIRKKALKLRFSTCSMFIV